MKTTLVLFVFHELNDRVDNFIKNAVFVSDDTDFVIVSNGGSSLKVLTSVNAVTVYEGSRKITLPSHVKFLSRPNIGHDFGAWSDGLLIDDLYQNYQNFIFVNSSVDGPFNTTESLWTQRLLNGLSSTVKLFGCTINTCGKPNECAHVQSYAFAMDKEALEYLIQCEIFSNTKYISNKYDVIMMKEIGMSRKIIERGWNIGSLLKCYNGIDWTVPYPTGKPFFDDIMSPMFEYVYWRKEELVFIKGNRW